MLTGVFFCFETMSNYIIKKEEIIMKKKTLAMFVALTLTSGLLAGCGNAEKATTSTTTEAATETASAVETSEQQQK